MVRAKIIGSGMYLPPHEVDNQTMGNFFPKSLDGKWTPEWVDEKLGILKRRNAFDFENIKMHDGPAYDGDYAFEAARAAIANARIAPEDIDYVIYLTSTPEMLMPDPACVLHARLGLREDTPAIGATAVGCGGFIYGMDMADSCIRSEKYKTVLVVGSIAVGSYVPSFISSDDPEERERLLRLSMPDIYIFADGAGALVMQATEEIERGVFFSYIGANGNDNPVEYKAGGSRYPATHETVYQGLHRFNMDTGLVRDVGPKLFTQCVEGVLKKSKMRVDDIDRFFFHQVNARLLKLIAYNLGISMEKVEQHVDRYGNLDTATLPVAYHEAFQSGRISGGETILFAAIGAGWQYGAMIVKI